MKHNEEKKYFEKFALNLLKEYKNIDISNFKDDEEPDWQDEINSMGIEVTRDSVGTKFWADLEKVKDKKISDKKVKEFNKKFIVNGGRILDKKTASIIGIDKCSFGYNDNLVYIIPSYSNSFERINIIIKEKTKKLNDHYKEKIQDNRLFIFSPMLINKDMAAEELIEIKNNQINLKRNFNIIYVCILYEIYTFDLIKNELNVIKMDEIQFNKISVYSCNETRNKWN